MAHKWPAIDILKLYSGKLEGFEDDTPQTFDAANINASRSYKMLKSHHKWNRWLDQCLKKSDLEELMKTRYGLQLGMADLVKKNLVTNNICEMFVRWQASIEKTARRIIKKKHKITRAIATDYLKAHAEKRRIDEEFEIFLRRSSY